MTWITSWCAASPLPKAESPDLISKLDLVAQQSMACWAEWAFMATSASVIVSAFALFGLFRSLSQTKRSLLDNREIGEMEVQAYVHASSVRFGEFNNIIVFCRNTGSSPATHFCVNGTVKLVKRGFISSSITISKEDFKVWPALGAGEELSVSIEAPEGLIAEFKANQDNDTVILVSGSIIYCTVFNHDHITDYAFFCGKARGAKFRRPTANLRAFHRIAGTDGPLGSVSASESAIR